MRKPIQERKMKAVRQDGFFDFGENIIAKFQCFFGVILYMDLADFVEKYGNICYSSFIKTPLPVLSISSVIVSVPVD